MQELALKPSPRLVLAADIGGTHSRLALAEGHSGKILHQDKYNNADFCHFNDVLRNFLQDSSVSRQPDEICLAIAAPIEGERIQMTNNPWLLDRQELMRLYPGADVHFINDFQAAALGTLNLAASQMKWLNPGRIDPEGLRAVIGAGTGLGTAILCFQDGRYQALPTQAGHISLAPQNDEEQGLFRHLEQRYGHVSYERVLSGAGLVSAYQYFSCGRDLSAGEINRLAEDGTDDAARTTMQTFASVFGNYIGNMVLAYMPTGGIYLVGGVTQKTSGWLESDIFRKSLRSKGRMAGLIEETGLCLVLDPDPGISGALHFVFHSGRTL